MLDRLGGFVPQRPSHRLLTAYLLAIVGILAVGDGLSVIKFPLYTLGLPDTALADAGVTVLGLGLFVAAYSLAGSALEESSGEADADQRVDIPASGEVDPVAIVEERYARGEIDDEEFEAKLERLERADSVDFDPADRETVIEKSGLADRKTAIE